MTEFAYEVWKSCINLIVEGVLGVGLADLPDQPFREWFDENMTIGEAASRIVREAKGELLTVLSCV